MTNGVDLGVRLCYLLYAQKITPSALVNISHELSHASELFRYLSSQNEDIHHIAKLISHWGKQNVRPSSTV